MFQFIIISLLLTNFGSKPVYLERCTKYLFEKLFFFTGTVPIIRSPKGNAAEQVSQKLHQKLRENLFGARSDLFHTDTQTGNFNFQRPLLIILDRNIDMATPLHHTWTYQALAHDLLSMSLNRVVLQESTPSGGEVTYFNKLYLMIYGIQRNLKI